MKNFVLNWKKITSGFKCLCQGIVNFIVFWSHFVGKLNRDNGDDMACILLDFGCFRIKYDLKNEILKFQSLLTPAA